MTEMKHASNIAQTAQFYAMAMKVIAKDNVHTFTQIANDENVKATGHILAWKGYDRDIMLGYVQEYGYEAVNEFVTELRKHLEAES